MATTPSLAPLPLWLREASDSVFTRGYLANEILPNIWLGRGAFAQQFIAQNGNKLGFTHVLTVANDTPEVRVALEAMGSSIMYKCVDVGDFGTDKGISRIFNEAFEFIDRIQTVENGRVFIHCANGADATLLGANTMFYMLVRAY